ncbi:hypothetical protein YQE_03618, partial [Dendroctonus ponderosae]
MAKAKNIIENAVVSSHSPNSLAGNSQAGSVGNLVSQGPFDLNVSTNVKLPPIPLPTFDGAYDVWLFFKDTFHSLIHDNASIANVQKFHYLRLSLKGPAADLLKSLECSAANYDIAWNLLIKRYENEKILIRNHVKALFDLEQVKPESHTSLRNLVDNLNKHLRALKVLKQPVAHWDALIIHMVSLKLDPVTRKEWEAEFAKHDISLDILTEFLHERCKLLETLQLIQPRLKHINRQSFVSVHSPICTFCKQNHTVYNCQEFLSLSLKERNSLSIFKVHYWCDSTIVLSWIRAESHNFKIFVGNRISQIQTLTTPKDWHYVSTTENPADLLSRGASPGVLMSSQLWWHGPSWLSKGSEYWPVDSINLHESELPEQRQTKINCFSSNG